MRTPIGVIIFISILLAIDLYVFQAVKAISQSANARTRMWVHGIYWAVTVFCIAGFVLFVFTRHELLGAKVRSYLFAIIIGLFLAKLTAVIFFLADDIRRLIQWAAGKLFFSNTEGETMNGSQGYTISRSVFLSWLGIGVGTTLFGSLLYGFKNKYNYQLKRVTLPFKNLPVAFNDLKVIHISDIHSGSLQDIKAVEHAVQMILKEKADIILFTGDLVNDKATEMKSLMPVFSRLNAPMGVYSTLGNHDYGDYVQWPIDGVSKEQNLEDLKKIHAQMGWRLLMNEHVSLERMGEKIALLGIENWSAKGRFPKYGNMQAAYADTSAYPFKILMSHDPSHWDAEVIPLYPDIDLMLSGHTHGMQFGVEMPGFQWSPVQYMYRQWAGLYKAGAQALYVNRGFGFIGYPGRVGILPEITVIQLHKA